ncbi:GAF domain-containing sensor histidine kinase [Pseudarthrobacter sp. TAF60_1]|uniref:GAF domain-containing sensor histidine kinase n=1 Tax=Pseudarthrobacter sp. TAF60_1 TaxID=3233071 RepID=UPI003F95B0BC
MDTVTFGWTAAESDRAAAIRNYGLAPTAAGRPPVLPQADAEGALTNLVTLAARLCAVPFSVVNIITEDRQVQIAAWGVDPGVCSREDSMCAQVFLSGVTTVVPDASQDVRFADNPFVTGEIAKVRYYASVPLKTASGFVLGSLCIFSDGPANPTGEQIEMLEVLAHQVVEVLELQHRTLQLSETLAELKRSNAMLGEFAGRISHDLRTPLTTMLGYIELAEDDPDIPPGHPAVEYLEFIGSGGRRMLKTLEDVLEYSQVDGTLQREPVSLLAVTEQAARDLGHDLGPASGIFSDDTELVADPVQLRSLLQNLLANSLNYSSPERSLRVTVGATVSERGVTVSVADNGVGISPADRKQAVEPLVRLNRAGDGPGTGLGLATCQRIAQAHGGELEIRDSPGGGVTISVLFRWDLAGPSAVSPAGKL